MEDEIMERNEYREENWKLSQDIKKEKRKKWFQRGIILVLIIVIILLLLTRCCGDKTNDGNRRNIVPIFSNDAVETGPKETMTDEQLQEMLDKIVKDGYINICMNTEVIFSNGKSMGNMGIENSEINIHPQVVQIYQTDENGEATDLIYTSPMIPVGGRIEKDRLNVNLPKGKYSCIAYFHSVTEDGEILGTAGAMISVIIKD